MMSSVLRWLLPLWLLFLASTAIPVAALAAEAQTPTPWLTRSADGSPRLHLYFFWSMKCPHCREAKPDVEALAAKYPWLQLHSLEITTDTANLRAYVEMANALGQEARSVPGFLYCGQMSVGYESRETTGALLEESLLACRDYYAGQGKGAETSPWAAARPPGVGFSVPLLGTVNLADFSLPLVTLILAGLDAFNPCAFFVLLFLLSILTHERERSRMAVIGGLFVLFSGFVYFALMAAWLNIFLVAGELRLVTVVAGLVALFMALVNVKDFVWFKRGISLSIPESAKPKLFERIRRLMQAQSWPAMLLGTVTLAVAANSYELLCTAGFPMVYTRLLTLQELPARAYYGYLALYNVVYVLPLLLIVVAFVRTLGSRKLTEMEGRVLKLVSGVMMLGLGLSLLFAPDWLNNPWVALAMVVVAAGLGLAAYRRERRLSSGGLGQERPTP